MNCTKCGKELNRVGKCYYCGNQITEKDEFSLRDSGKFFFITFSVFLILTRMIPNAIFSMYIIFFISNIGYNLLKLVT